MQLFFNGEGEACYTPKLAKFPDLSEAVIANERATVPTLAALVKFGSTPKIAEANTLSRLSDFDWHPSPLQ